MKLKFIIILVVGLNKGNRYVNNLNLGRPTSVYQVKGEFGIATDTHWDDGKVWEKTTYAHISKSNFDRVMASIQASNQKSLFQYEIFTFISFSNLTSYNVLQILWSRS